MSEPENFLTRWSRRKREATEENGRQRPHDEAASGEPISADHQAMPAPPEATASEPAAAPPSLPPVESIDIGTDIRGFLAKEVPPDLARAALRRAWLADPAIRDFVGLADYDWDFNSPAGIAGFGPLRPTDDVAQLLGQMLGSDLAPATPSASGEAGREEVPTAEASGTVREGPEGELRGPGEDSTAVRGPATAASEPPEAPPLATSDKQKTKPGHDRRADGINASSAAEEAPPEAVAPQYSQTLIPAVRRHGGALPE
jgi:hypothetical protein